MEKTTTLMKEKEQLERELSSLPDGYLSKKTIRNQTKYYLQWQEGGKKKSKYIDASSVELLSKQIERRREIQKRIREINAFLPKRGNLPVFRSTVFVGDALREFVNPVSTFKKRDCYQRLTDYLYGDSHDRVFILFGLRRTGKTTLIRQAIGNMDDVDFQKAAFIQTKTGDSLSDMNADLNLLKEKGYRFVFI
ncbi:MAG: ATP-binding protein, partial [Bacilli bacterium]|nr:ATP-binding protein [Bacilli bacterium]